MINSLQLKIFIAAVGIAALLPAASHAMELSDATVKEFTMTVKGGSTLHDWESEVTQLTAGGTVGVPEGDTNASQSLRVEIPVKSLKSPHDKMDRLTYEALKEKKHPRIKYELISLTAVEEGKMRAEGNLTIAGETRPLEMEVETSVNGNQELTVVGEADLKMTDFGMKPPSLMLGTIKVRDPVSIAFRLTLVATSNDK